MTMVATMPRETLPARGVKARALLAALALLAGAAPGGHAAAQDPPAEQPPRNATIKLWPQGAPGSTARRGEAEIGRDYWVRNIHDPSLIPFPVDAARRNGAAVVIIPGGGHKLLVWTNEGTKVATALGRRGVTAFVLKYRLAREAGSPYSIEGEAADDARRAIRWVRAHAADYGIDPARVGAMGFSAGGELVSLIADNPEPAGRPVVDAIDRLPARPDFQILVFPGPLGIPGKAIAGAPPAFLVAGSRDPCCAAPSVALYEQLRKAGISAELHMYADSGHAFNLDESNRISILHWPDRLNDWLADGGWLSPRPAPAAR
jgi:acetyl esterase/lipase